MAEYVSLPPTVLHRLPDAVTALEGAYTEPLATAVHLTRVAGVRIGASAVVLGGGPIGLLTVQVLRRAGASHITVVEPSPARREMAARLGASLTIRGSIIYVEEFPLAIRLLEQRAIDVETMTTKVMPLDSYEEPFRLLGQPENVVKILLRP